MTASDLEDHMMEIASDDACTGTSNLAGGVALSSGVMIGASAWKPSSYKARELKLGTVAVIQP